jgi:DNA-binding XRE family transcriptional regulator
VDAVTRRVTRRKNRQAGPVTDRVSTLTVEEHTYLGTVGMRLRLRRVVLGVSQDVLAARAGMSRVTYGRIERGEHATQLLCYARVAAAAGLPVGRLLDADRSDLP